jgi:hypothetical protein
MWHACQSVFEGNQGDNDFLAKRRLGVLPFVDPD